MEELEPPDGDWTQDVGIHEIHSSEACYHIHGLKACGTTSSGVEESIVRQPFETIYDRQH